MSAAPALYSPDVLALAIKLADFPLTDAFPLTGAARSTACGSTLDLGLETDTAGRIERIGLRAHACAVGQAAAAVFAGAATGRDRHAIAAADAAISAWLAGDAPLPDWPGLGVLVRARDYPARHGAVMLPWRAALAALPSATAPR